MRSVEWSGVSGVDSPGSVPGQRQRVNVLSSARRRADGRAVCPRCRRRRTAWYCTAGFESRQSLLLSFFLFLAKS